MEDGSLVFAKPHEEEQDFEEFLDYVINQEKDPSSQGEIRYAQTPRTSSQSRPKPKNNNLHDEYSPLLPTSPPLCPSRASPSTAPPTP
ncbi:hypothetical protein jhhlp_002530 [Lomentospora prolificans]|uniref:Uncharacterized protein n=1 Tax=Lomentospora prolificans TaxID=41688 RepID=A0A2N3NEC6_9PEZI|nr:hypothetical protein jhhlp_002530 [Lomentospora prolificans]